MWRNGVCQQSNWLYISDLLACFGWLSAEKDDQDWLGGQMNTWGKIRADVSSPFPSDADGGSGIEQLADETIAGGLLREITWL